MANRKISDLTALTATAVGDLLPIVDISEAAAASKNKRVTIQSLFQGIPVNVGIGTASPSELLELSATTDPEIQFTDVGNVISKIGISASTALTFEHNGSERVGVDAWGRVGIGTASPTTLLDVNADTVRVRTARTPASATATGATGEICWDANYIYVCTATNTWKRTAIATW